MIRRWIWGRQQVNYLWLRFIHVPHLKVMCHNPEGNICPILNITLQLWEVIVHKRWVLEEGDTWARASMAVPPSTHDHSISMLLLSWACQSVYTVMHYTPLCTWQWIFIYVLPEGVARKKQLGGRVWTLARSVGLMIQGWSQLRWCHDMMNLHTKNINGSSLSPCKF
jgi:hypothetical protein